MDIPPLKIADFTVRSRLFVGTGKYLRNGEPDYERIEAVDLALFNENLADLCAGKTVKLYSGMVKTRPAMRICLPDDTPPDLFSDEKRPVTPAPVVAEEDDADPCPF